MGELERAGFAVNIYDAISKFDTYDQIRETICAYSPGFIGTTSITATINDCKKVLKMAKEEILDCTTFLGGVHPTFCYGEILEEHPESVDYCILGEGEITAPELLHAHLG